MFITLNKSVINYLPRCTISLTLSQLKPAPQYAEIMETTFPGTRNVGYLDPPWLVATFKKKKK